MTTEALRSRADRLRAVPLEAVLVFAGAERDRRDCAKWHTQQGVIAVSGPKFMNFTRGIGGGGAIDLVIHLQGLPFMSALDWLSSHFAEILSPIGVEPDSRPRLDLPTKDAGMLPRVARYLTSERSLAPCIIESLISDGTIYADQRGNAVFLLLGKSAVPVGAEIRGTTLRPWKGMAPGSKKDNGYFSVPNPRATMTVLCESAIDAISCSILCPESTTISTAGARPDPRWLSELLDNDDICCGFDADPTGDEMARQMIALHPSVRRLRPPIKDWNDLLHQTQ